MKPVKQSVLLFNLTSNYFHKQLVTLEINDFIIHSIFSMHFNY